MSRTSSFVKEKWKSKSYDKISFYVLKGGREIINEASNLTKESVSEFIRNAVQMRLDSMKGDARQWNMDLFSLTKKDAR